MSTTTDHETRGRKKTTLCANGKRTYDRVLQRHSGQAAAQWIDVYEPLTAFPTYARACDIVVAGGRSSDPSMSTLDDDVSATALLETGRLALFAAHPTAADVDPFARVLIAWDDKPTAARTIALGLPLHCGIRVGLPSHGGDRLSGCDAVQSNSRLPSPPWSSCGGPRHHVRLAFCRALDCVRSPRLGSIAHSDGCLWA